MEAFMEEHSSDVSVASDIQTLKASNVDRARRVSLSPSKDTIADAARSPFEEIVESFLRKHGVQWSDMEEARFFNGLVGLCKGVTKGYFNEETFIFLSSSLITPAQAEELYVKLQDYQAEAQAGQRTEGEQGSVSTLTAVSARSVSTLNTVSTESSTKFESEEHSSIAGHENAIRAGPNGVINDEENLLAHGVFPAHNSTDGNSQPLVIADGQTPIRAEPNSSTPSTPINEEENLCAHEVHAQDGSYSMDVDREPRALCEDSE